MDMNRGIARRRVRTSACALAFLGSFVFLASAALAQTCTPVVYAFRHAEDSNPSPGTFTLTPSGKAHAALYPSMVSSFENAAPNNFCPVTKVYAVTKKGKVNCSSNCTSATNAFDTSRPTACWVASKDLTKCTCWLRAKDNQDADACAATMTPDPSTKVGKYDLYEYLGNGNNPPTSPSYTTPEATALRDELKATANAGSSSAIFWTSDGLHVLAGAIIEGTSKVPDKKGSDPKATKGTPPRNAVYVFQFVTAQGQFIDTPTRPDLYVQGYNRGETSGKFASPQFIDSNLDGTQDYYAGYQPNVLGGVLDERNCAVGDPCGSTIPTVQLEMVKGRICDTSNPLKNSPGPGYYGACRGPSTAP
jgi:hypothetical protein